MISPLSYVKRFFGIYVDKPIIQDKTISQFDDMINLYIKIKNEDRLYYKKCYQEEEFNFKSSSGTDVKIHMYMNKKMLDNKDKIKHDLIYSFNQVESLGYEPCTEFDFAPKIKNKGSAAASWSGTNTEEYYTNNLLDINTDYNDTLNPSGCIHELVHSSQPIKELDKSDLKWIIEGDAINAQYKSNSSGFDKVMKYLIAEENTIGESHLEKIFFKDVSLMKDNNPVDYYALTSFGVMAMEAKGVHMPSFYKEVKLKGATKAFEDAGLKIDYIISYVKENMIDVINDSKRKQESKKMIKSS